MEHQGQLPLIMPATHQPPTLVSSEDSNQSEAGIKQRDLYNKSQNNSEVRQSGKEQSASRNQSGNSSQSKLLMSKTKKWDGKSQHQNAKLAEIIKRKKELDQKIVRIKYQQDNQQKITHKGYDRNARSQITEDEKQRIRQALEERKRYEEITNAKNKQLEQEIREKEKAEQQTMMQKIESIRSIKRKEALSHLEMLKLQQQERTKAIKQANKQFEEVKLKTFLHEKMEEKWKSQLVEKEQSNKHLLATINQKKKFSAEQLNRHEHQYKKLVQKDTIERMRNRSLEIEEKKSVEKETLSKYQPSQFLRTIFEEEEQLKKQQKSKTSQLFSNISRKTAFAQTVRQHNKQAIIKRQTLSPIKQTEDSQPDMQKHNKGRSLSQIDLLKLGNSYMREVNSSLSEYQPDKAKDRKIEVTLIKYDDYLREQRERRVKMQTNPEVIELRELTSLMKRKLPVDEKWLKAKLLTSRLEERDDLSTDMLLRSISTKISLINQLRGQ